MAGAIIENLSGRKLFVLVFFLLIGLLTSFLLGGLIAPSPTGTIPVLGTVCLDKNYNETNFYWSRGSGMCETVSLASKEMAERRDINANNIIFVFQIPLPRVRQVLDFSRWQQQLLAMLLIQFSTDDNQHLGQTLTIDAKLAYRSKRDRDEDWKLYASSLEERTLDCDEVEGDRETLHCVPITIFELGSLHHDYYLLNLRFPNSHPLSHKKLNEHLIRFEDLTTVFIHQNGGFTRVWVSIKTVFFPILIGIMAWFWHRISALSRPPALLEYMLMVLGASLTLLNFPVEYITLMLDCPWMLLFTDLRQGIFYTALLSFWLIFAGEHLMDDIERNRLRAYCRHLSAVGGGCLCLFIFDICERGMQLHNPFNTIWSSEAGTNIAFVFIAVAGICAIVYFAFLCYMIRKVFINISSKQKSLPAMALTRRMKYQGVIYRFKVLMLATLLCAAMTVAAFIFGEVSEGQPMEDHDYELEEEPFEYKSSFLTGVYGMWNIYTIAVICLYAPSHKKWPKETDAVSSTGEEIEFSQLNREPSEMSSLTAFTQKASAD